jgi:hypothetical protein
VFIILLISKISMSDSTNAKLAVSSASAPSILASTVSTSSTPPELATLSPSEVPTCPDSSKTSVLSPSSSEDSGKFDNAYNCEYTIDLFSRDRTNSDRFKALYSMYIGTHIDVYAGRLQNLLKSTKCDLSISKVKPFRTMLGVEVVHCFMYLKLAGTLPLTANWTNKKLTEALSSTRYSLPCEELDFVQEELELSIKHYEDIVKEEEERLELLGHDICVHNCAKMRLWHTFFADKHRAKLLKCQDVLSRLAVDASKSQQRPSTLYEDVAKDYNDPTWIPMSHPVPSFS